MSSSGKFAATWVIGLWVAAVLQQSLSPHLRIFVARPDFLLIFTVAVSLFLTRRTAAGLGFTAGLIEGAVAGAHLAPYAISRAVAGFVTAWSRVMGLEVNKLVVALTAFLATIIAGLLWMFSAAPANLGAFLGDTIGSAMYNGVLAIPVYMLLERVLNPRSRSGL